MSSSRSASSAKILSTTDQRASTRALRKRGKACCAIPFFQRLQRHVHSNQPDARPCAVEKSGEEPHMPRQSIAGRNCKITDDKNHSAFEKRAPPDIIDVDLEQLDRAASVLATCVDLFSCWIQPDAEVCGANGLSLSPRFRNRPVACWDYYLISVLGWPGHHLRVRSSQVGVARNGHQGSEEDPQRVRRPGSTVYAASRTFLTFRGAFTRGVYGQE